MLIQNISAMLSARRLLLTTLLFVMAAAAQGQSTDTFDLDQVYTIDADGTISLNSDDAEVTIVGSDRTDVHVTVHYRLEIDGFTFGSHDRFEMTVRETNGNLVIREQPRDFSGVTIGSTDEEYTIRIEAPRGLSLDLEGDDEHYDIREIDGRIDLDADDADVALTACRGSRFAISLDDGRLTMDQGRGKLSLDVDDGSADIRIGSFDTIDLSSDDGDFRIATALSDGGSYDFDMDDGAIAFVVRSGGGMFHIRHDDADITAGSAFRQTLDEENEAEYELAGGSARIRFDADDTDIELHSIN